MENSKSKTTHTSVDFLVKYFRENRWDIIARALELLEQQTLTKFYVELDTVSLADELTRLGVEIVDATLDHKIPKNRVLRKPNIIFSTIKIPDGMKRIVFFADSAGRITSQFTED